MILDKHYEIAVRAGMHCSPLSHEALGTTKTGLIRASFGVYNTKDEKWRKSFTKKLNF